jgi:glycolate oxidase iron-sulfur subunit
VEAIVMTASGCGATVREYAHFLGEDPQYRAKAERISSLTRDLCEVLEPQMLPKLESAGRVAFQSPCSLQHGQQIRGKVEALLARAGFELSGVDDAHLCCGSAGTYSLLQPELSGELRLRKLRALHAGGPARIATANIGCLAHLQAGTDTPVLHWIELLDEVLQRRMPA